MKHWTLIETPAIMGHPVKCKFLGKCLVESADKLNYLASSLVGIRFKLSESSAGFDDMHVASLFYNVLHAGR
jgi:hypothetical protein